MTQLLYLEDPLTLEFQANVTRFFRLPDGRLGVLLESTYFYPTGGGQEHDTGWIGEARVAEVFKYGEDRGVIHVVEGEVSPGIVAARIDSERRQRHMQHHTAQHLLSQCFIQLYDLETLSANINGYTPSTIDLPIGELTTDQLLEAEDLANRIIYEDRPVRIYFVSPSQLDEFPLRKPPKVTQDIRLVEIDGFDFSACGGTHCISTGGIGLLKIHKFERLKEGIRVHFIAGLQALDNFRMYQEVVQELAARLSVGPHDLLVSFQRLVDQQKELQKILMEQERERIAKEADSLYKQALEVGSFRVVVASFDDRPVRDVRRLAEMLLESRLLVALLLVHDGQKISMIVTCGEEVGLDAREILTQALSPLGGRGGGDERLAQGGGLASVAQFRELVETTWGNIEAMFGSLK